MDLTLTEASERLQSQGRYRRAFLEAFGREPNAEDLARALASYVRTIVAGDSLFDGYLAGDQDALSEDQHAGPTLTDEEFHNTGTAWHEGEWLDDGRLSVTREERDRGKFKTPTLREISRTAPYMHDGALATLEDVVAFYSDGGQRNPNLDRSVVALDLSPSEKTALAAFLRVLSGSVQDGF